MADAVSISGLTKRYGSTAALRGVDLKVVEGELFGLIGPDGAGKTTLLRILCGLIWADEGAATLFDLDVKRENAKIRKLLGYMPQRFSLYPDLSVKENLIFFADIFGVTRRERRERMSRLLRFSRLGPFAKRRAQALSGGMKQKLALSCTLIHQPRILLLDEPTTGVDPLSRREFWSILSELKAEGVTILVSTPYMDEAGKCDRIAFIHHGAILAADSPQAIPHLFPHKIVEVRAPNLQSVKDSFRAIDGVIALKTFGDRIHLTTAIPTAVMEELKLSFEARRQTDFQIAEVQPGIEDTFMALMENR